jgi:hypothetical protein
MRKVLKNKYQIKKPKTSPKKPFQNFSSRIEKNIETEKK